MEERQSGTEKEAEKEGEEETEASPQTFTLP
jgi:hypothetical protein